jgi:hypothetical protein
MDSNTETEAAVWKIKKPNVFGHPSQLTKFEPVELNVPCVIVLSQMCPTPLLHALSCSF